ncbi:MAG TPA: cation:proton antiporter, partial [Tepidisphaeraceae bacterium]|nr:cation:proton antiporter [Tepidisphaeraceae bacterium]
AMVAVQAIVGGAIYTIIVLTIGRRIFAKLDQRHPTHESISLHRLALVLAALMFCCFLTERIGVHVIFGGFVLGVAMPRGAFSHALRRSIEPFAVVFLLPMFFTYSGLNTRLDLINRPELWVAAIVVLLAATLGKLGACWGAARLMGESNRTAFGIGTLMNSRGLIELIILNIGLQHKLITPELFSIMVLMAIITTLATTPLFNLAWPAHMKIDQAIVPEPVLSK